jgi:hypothetical protein
MGKGGRQKAVGRKQQTENISITNKQSEQSGARFNNASKRRSLLSIERSEIHHQIG